MTQEYLEAKDRLPPGDRLALRYVEYSIAADPDNLHEHRRAIRGGWVVDESCSALLVVYRRTSETEGVLGFVFRRSS